MPKKTSIGILNTSFALGGMYVQIPFEFFDEDIGLGIAFGTVTLGNNFNHFSTSIGWGYTRYSGDWELDDPVGQSLDVYRSTRDEIERRVRGLIE